MKMCIDNKTGVSIIGTLITLIVLFISMLKNDVYICWLAILLLFVIIVYYTVKESDAPIVFQGFLISFFVFILGMYLSQIITGDLQSIFSDDIFLKESVYVYISLLTILIGYAFFKKKRVIFKKYNERSLKNYRRSTKKIGSYSKSIFFICILFSIAVNIDVASMTIGNIYSFNRTVETRMPFIFQKIGQMSGMFFWIYLSTLPEKKQIKLPCYLFVFDALLTLFTGSRNVFVRNAMSIVMYIFFRNKIRNELKEGAWLSGNMKFLITLSMPVMVTFLGALANIRLGEDAQYEGILAGVMYFLEQQGSSIDVIGRGIYCKENFLLPDSNVSYTFGPIINYFRNGLLGGWLGCTPLSTSSQDVALATYGNNLGATVTYLMAESYYFIGGGFGTCYIAELVVDFGYVGVIIYNLFLGWLFNNINYHTSETWWKNAIGLLIIRDVLFMPRDFALAFVASLLSITNLLPLLILLILEKYMRYRVR